MSILFYFILSYYYFLEFYFIIRDRKREKESSGWAKMTGGGRDGPVDLIFSHQKSVFMRTVIITSFTH